MVSTGLPHPLPDNVADLFAVLYDWFDKNHFFSSAENEYWYEEILHGQDLKELSSQVAQSGWEVPSAIMDRLSHHLYLAKGEALARLVYLVLHSIDRGLGFYHPRSPNHPTVYPPRRNVATQYAENGRYNTDAIGGYVLPKFTQGFRGTSLQGHFVNLIRANVDRAYVRVIGRNTGTGPEIRQETLQVGIVPFLYSLEEVFVEGIEMGSKHLFEVKHRDSILRNRVRSAVEDLRISGVHIGIFPELALSYDLL
jgi:hypothetical protein